MTPPTISTFKGNEVLVLNPDDKYTFSFGKSKALLICKHIRAIKEFAGVDTSDEDLADAADEFLEGA